MATRTIRGTHPNCNIECILRDFFFMFYRILMVLKNTVTVKETEGYMDICLK